MFSVVKLYNVHVYGIIPTVIEKSCFHDKNSSLSLFVFLDIIGKKELCFFPEKG